MVNKYLILSISGLIIGRLGDLISTYLATPDLAYEGNPLVIAFNWGWNEVIVLNIIIISVFSFILFYYFKRYLPNQPTYTSKDYKQYISYIYFKEPNSFWKLLYKFPKNIKAFVIHSALIFIYSFSFFTIFIVIHNLLAAYAGKYIYKITIGNGINPMFILYSFFFIIFGITTYRVYLFEFKQKINIENSIE